VSDALVDILGPIWRHGTPRMATQLVQEPFDDSASADLTPLGMRLEILRIQRGLSKQGLARTAGTSRQQLWRVMTGKSELTTSLRQRLATALQCDLAVIATLDDATAPSGFPRTSLPPASFSEYLASSHHLLSTLGTLPGGEGGRQMKRALMHSLELLAGESAHALPTDFWEIQRRVQAGEL
jgi:transcriptional regulator with XRE-family HTH domain